MKQYQQYIVTAIAVCLLVLNGTLQTGYAYADLGKEASYVYSRHGYDVKIPHAYEYKGSVFLKDIEELTITSPIDMFVSSANEVYIVDGEAGAVLYFDRDLRFVEAIHAFTAPNGEKTTLKKPEGVFVTEDRTYYIADTGNNRVLVADQNQQVQMEIGMPKDLMGTQLSSFLPTKIVVDTAGRISVTARNINSGIMQFSAEGEFTGYTGAPTVTVDAFTKLLRKFSTQAQRAQMQRFVPTEYNNIKIDARNFIWGTISSLSAQDVANAINSRDVSGKITPVKKLNTMGVDVLRRKGIYAPMGDLYFLDNPSRIIDIGLGPNNMYTLLDSKLGRMFTYNHDGILLYAFGNKGNRKGNTQVPAAIDYQGENILVLDAALCEIIIFQPTKYGWLLMEAEEHYTNGDYEQAYEKWAEVAELNSNFEYAYVGLGNAKYNEAEYETAMEYYQYASDRGNYSKAKEKLRKEGSKKIFPMVFMTVVFLIGLYLASISVKSIRKYARGQ